MSKLIKAKIPVYIQEKIIELKRTLEKKLLKRKITKSEEDMLSLGYVNGVMFSYGAGWTLPKIAKDLKRGD